MERHTSLLLEVWREACRHIELADPVRSASSLRRRLPLDAIWIRRIDLAGGALETAAIARSRSGESPAPGRIDLAPRDLERLLAWCRRGGSPTFRSRACRTGCPACWLRDEGDVLAGPLTGEDGPLGIVALLVRPPRVFREEHAELLAALLEPFAVALENDRRLREMKTLREAAEADRRSLLARLGRKDLTESIVGVEGGLRPVMERVEQVARLDVPVLILGETGSGKEVVARAIHTRSRRASGSVSARELRRDPRRARSTPSSSDTSAGASPAPSPQRKGWFERADGGTLFLDEIGELPLDAQVRLLRVLQDGILERVGGHRAFPVDVRIVAATHRDLYA